jgi:hypothetical protein
MKLLAMVTAAAVFAAWSFQASAQGNTETVNGHLIDVMCATKHAKEGSTYAEQHHKKCLLMDGCVKSGYAVLTADNRLLKLDQTGSQIALDLIKKTDRERDWKVTVTGRVTNDQIAVSTLALQQ